MRRNFLSIAFVVFTLSSNALSIYPIVMFFSSREHKMKDLYANEGGKSLAFVKVSLSILLIAGGF